MALNAKLELNNHSECQEYGSEYQIEDMALNAKLKMQL